MKHDEVLNTLESIIDKYSISVVVSTLSEIASEKASHVRSNWQDEPLARKWEHMAKVLDRAYTPINKADRELP